MKIAEVVVALVRKTGMLPGRSTRPLHALPRLLQSKVVDSAIQVVIIDRAPGHVEQLSNIAALEFRISQLAPFEFRNNQIFQRSKGDFDTEKLPLLTPHELSFAERSRFRKIRSAFQPVDGSIALKWPPLATERNRRLPTYRIIRATRKPTLSRRRNGNEVTVPRAADRIITDS
jgi:hypothetical protein